MIGDTGLKTPYLPGTSPRGAAPGGLSSRPNIPRAGLGLLGFRSSHFSLRHGIAVLFYAGTSNVGGGSVFEHGVLGNVNHEDVRPWNLVH
jgi:hypothetical protein